MSRRYALDAPALFIRLSQQNQCIQSEQMIFCQSLGFDESQRKRLQAQEWIYSPVSIWLGSDLQTQAGQLVGTQLHSQQREGFISYGPYLGLRKGSYRYEIEYQSQQLPQEVIGYWDVMLNLAGAPKQLARGDLVGSSSEQKIVQGEFVLEHDAMDAPLEIRNYVQAKGDLKISAVRIYKREMKDAVAIK
jgi:hypothetical protein